MYNDKSTIGYIRLVRVLSALLGLLQLAYFVLAWFVPEPMHAGPVAISFTPRGMDTGVLAGLAPAMHWAGIACALPALLLLGYALLRLDRMLRACAGGRMFALDTVGHMKAFTGCVLGALVWTIVEPALRGFVWRHGLNGPGAVSMGVSSEELTLVLVCALFFVVASMMHAARRIAEENEGFV